MLRWTISPSLWRSTATLGYKRWGHILRERYSQLDAADVVEYARLRGIRVMLEVHPFVQPPVCPFGWWWPLLLRPPPP